jgi:two-component system, NtrC family, sensor kinase
MKLYLTVLLFAISFIPVSGQQEIFKDVDSLMKKLSAASTDTARILLQCRLGEAYRSNNPDTSLILANEALTGSTEIKFKKGEIHALVLLCVMYREKGDLPLALEYGLKALRIAEEERYVEGQISSLVRLANVYLAVRDAPKAITYLKKSEVLLKNHYDDFWWSVTQFFLADGYEQLNKLDEAENIVQILEKKKGSDPLWIVINNRLHGNIATKRNKLPLAIEYYRKSNAAAIAGTSFREAATASNSMAFVFKKLDQPDSAIFYAKQGLKFGEMLSYRNRILAASNLLAELYAEKDPKEAVKYYQIASAAKDSLYGVQKVQQLQSATMKEQERQTELEAARLAYQNKVRQWALLGGIGAFLVIALILYGNNRQKQKTNKVLETTLADLRTTQSQLVHAEKMASLGELTAGIAHEIQNPLNFVNNFSEVNKELADELKTELATGNMQQATEIINDIKDNSEKINHHGKRADAIVKGMLQHSRSSTGQKESTDINALCDEYLRLAYHGLRAKDGLFDVKAETEFDPNIEKIKVVPQDIGRVMLNLINNAFYAVDEKKKGNQNGYEPTVSVSTKKNNGRVEIRVADNGNGIPQKVLDKIFQPFFTTKPTGQGTGLGLSLAYDIVRAHGGELKVETKEGEGSEFIIQLRTN